MGGNWYGNDFAILGGGMVGSESDLNQLGWKRIQKMSQLSLSITTYCSQVRCAAPKFTLRLLDKAQSKAICLINNPNLIKYLQPLSHRCVVGDLSILYKYFHDHVMSYHIISYHIISYHIISYHIISYHIISYHIISYHIISYHIISYHIM